MRSYTQFDPRSFSKLVDHGILGMRGCKKCSSNARAIVGELGNHRRRGLFPEQVCKSCFYTTAELLVMFIEPTIQGNDSLWHFTAITWYFVPAYLLQDAIDTSSSQTCPTLCNNVAYVTSNISYFQRSISDPNDILQLSSQNFKVM
uniref:Uncharacterized protein n=1 Tax=Arundo donax TaxID=35708 RepID=A0A0A9DR97_ARUDO